MDRIYDVAIIGGGINGCGCAADAALRGLSTVLLEKDDLASKTSSSSTKLIHGGLRYLENFEFNLVKKALNERQVLLNIAPHIVHPQPFVLPYQKHMRPAWLLRLGLFIYDYLSNKNKLPRCRSIERRRDENYFQPLIDDIKKGFIYYDGFADDARLTIFNALQAKNYGASIRPHSAVRAIQCVNKLWNITVQPKLGLQYVVQAKSIINATGPWVNTINQLAQVTISQNISLVKGSHIVVPKIYSGQHAYFLQHDDKRIIFVIPYQDNTMIGTTEVQFDEAPEIVNISQDEISYLIHIVNSYFKQKLTQQDILYTWSGIRPLINGENKNMRKMSRDYSYLVTDMPAPMVSIYGGKITTYRQLSVEVIDQLKSIFPHLGHSVTDSTPLPGACFNSMSFDEYQLYARNKYNWMDPALLHRYLQNYGTCMEIFLAQCNSMASLGKCFGSSLFQIEVDYLVLEEWAQSSEDILLRRTKLGLSNEAICQKELADYLSTITAYPPDLIEPVFH